MTYQEFRNDSDKVKALREALQQPIIVEAMAVLKDEGPEKKDVTDDITPTYAATRLGHIIGYTHYANQLKMLATYITQPERVEANYTDET